MKLIPAWVVLACALTLGGCLTTSTGTPLNPITVLTTSVQNPVTRTEVAALVQTYNTVLIPVRKYVKLRTCKDGEAFPVVMCATADARASIRANVTEASKWRKELVTFVKNNDMVSASVAYNELNRVLDILKSGPKVGG